jgi:hypothetical protein
MPRSENIRIVAGAVLLASILAGCSDIYYDRRETVSFAAGNAVASAEAVHTIDPWPPASANRHIDGNGIRVAGAIERYRTGRIIRPSGTGTSSVAYSPTAQTGQGGGGTGAADSPAAAPGPAAK